MSITNMRIGENPEIQKDWEEIKKMRKGKTEKLPDKYERPYGGELFDERDKKMEVMAAIKPEWINGNEDAEAIWQDFVAEFLKAEMEMEEGEDLIAAEYYDHYFKIILGELADPFLPKKILNDHDGFGGEFWDDDFYAGRDHKSVRAAQYLSPRNILEFRSEFTQSHGQYYHAIRSVHFNLCGQLAVIEAMGINLPKGFRIFYEQVDDRDKDNSYILGNPNMGTYAADLIYFILAIAETQDESWSVEHQYLISREDRVEALKTLVERNEIVIALVDIDPSPMGNGCVGGGVKTAHWVVLQDIFDLAGEIFLRLYNPFMNREEVYLWETFDRGWEMAELNSAPRLIWGRKKG